MRYLVPLTLMIALAGCGSPEVIQPRSPTNAAGVDLSGDWQMREDPQQMARQLNRAIFETAGIRMDIMRPARGARNTRNDGRAKGGLVHVFLETGRNLKITQTDAGMFLSFDRSVVEEYRFGEHREISVGQVDAERVSGWAGSHYVVETLDRNGMKLSEDLSLSADADILTRRIVLRSKSNEEVTVVQTFSRKDNRRSQRKE